MLKIESVECGSIAEELELVAGDSLLSINGKEINDLLDYELAIEREELKLQVLKAGGEVWELDLEKDLDESLGLCYSEMIPTQCGNNCIFCFVHQLPKGMRRTLYVKDEDYRFSYLYGSYVTLTNITDAQVQRIIEDKLSPLYVSVHATEEQLRKRLIGKQGLPILDLLKRLVAEGIEIHTQIVLCPGFNDGDELIRSIKDLYALYPGVKSLAVVPVGLTGYREKLPSLRLPTQDEARQVIELLEGFSRKFLAEGDSRFVFGADEFYLKAGVEFPPLEAYEDLSQIENGVGLIPLFRSQIEEVLEEAVPLSPGEVSTVTGYSSAKELQGFTERLSEATGVTIHCYAIKNDFFGGHVTVTGLLTGGDIIRQLKGKPLGRELLLPDVLLKEGTDLLLDDVSLSDIEEALGVSVYKIPCSPWGLLDGVEAGEG